MLTHWFSSINRPFINHTIILNFSIFQNRFINIPTIRIRLSMFFWLSRCSQWCSSCICSHTRNWVIYCLGYYIKLQFHWRNMSSCWAIFILSFKFLNSFFFLFCHFSNFRNIFILDVFYQISCLIFFNCIISLAIICWHRFRTWSFLLHLRHKICFISILTFISLL